jgi:Holliday junction resolvasome RuvABC ATP-dependent DNA helicase subunit
MFLLYDRQGLTFYQCSNCDNKKSKYEIEGSEKKEQHTFIDTNKQIETLKQIYESEIYGYDDIKGMIIDICDLHLKEQLDKPSHLLLCGASGTSKTFFFELMLKVFDQNTIQLIDCSHLTGSGLVSYLVETGDYKTLSFIVLDELDKLDKKHQRSLLLALENGILSEKKYKRNISLDVSNINFFATGNDKTKIYEPLCNRFTMLEIPPYSYQQYRQITDNWILKKCPSNSVELIGVLFPNNKDTETIQIRTLKRLVDLSVCNPAKLVQYLKTIDKYGSD